MSSQPVVSMLGASPRVRLVPVAADSEGHLACDLAAAYGLRPFDWQRDALAGLMGVRADGRWAASRAGLVVPRQNGKNGAAEIYELWVTSQLGMRVLHSAHEVKTARKAFKRLLDFYDNPRRWPELHSLVKEIRRTNGQEAIELHNGGSVEFLARTKSSGRGYSADVLLLDEAQELTEEELEAMQPTVSASQNSQIILMGTAPKAEKPASVWRRWRATGEAGVDPRLFWLDYSATPDDDFSSREVWAAANPGAPVSISWEAIEDEFAAMSLAGFAAERLGVWFEQTGGSTVLPLDAWTALADPSVPQGSPLAYSLEVALGRASATIGAAWKVNGRPHLSVAKHATGTDWVIDALTRACNANPNLGVTIDAGTEALSFKEPLEAQGVTVHVTRSADRAALCAQFHDAVLAGGLSHDGQPLLDTALAGATWREGAEGARAFARKGGADISPLYALVLALHGVGRSFDVTEAIW